MRIGFVFSQESKNKMSLARKGKKNPHHSEMMKGRKLSEKHKASISKSKKGKVPKNNLSGQFGLKKEKHWNWKGGVSGDREYLKIYHKKRNAREKEHLAVLYKIWRLKNYERVNESNNRRRIKKAGNGGYHTIEEWKSLKEKYRERCAACYTISSVSPLTRDHIIPISKGGSDDIENIQPLCRSCNSRKKTNIIKYNMQNSQTNYQVINLDTKEISKVTGMTFGNTEEQYTDVTFTEQGEEKTIRFSNIGNEGNLLNESYAIRQEDGDTPNEDGTVTDEGVEIANE
jgi:5-methylcytosine-specific restriction endonuclease McrA